MRDLRLLVQAAPGGNPFPAGCFATVRYGDAASVGGAPTRCKANEVSCLGEVPEAGCVANIDFFQYVGSVSVGLREPGAFAEASVAWPGLQDGEVLTLRLVVASADDQTAAFAAGGFSPASPASLASPASPAAQQQPLPPPATQPASLPASPWMQPAAEPEHRQSASVSTRVRSASRGASVSRAAEPPMKRTASPAVQQRSPRGQKSYRPIVLNNCDQILPNLYLGGVAAATDTAQLVTQGIRAVCCCVRELEFPTSEFNAELEYYRVDVEDISREPIEYFFPEATEFIHGWISREQPVLVHCRAGVSRSASVVIAYLIAYQGYSLHDAFFLTRSHRSIVTPNIGFMEKLGEFEESKRGTDPTIDINKYVAWYTTPGDRAAVPDLKPD
mmetsp:Transcript_77628/g.222416  ORF Transcript_77628/g.222416 Transcript_77628/m.222416 type:complete len:388 (-) Transcript_77628:234-1397(-)